LQQKFDLLVAEFLPNPNLNRFKSLHFRFTNQRRQA